MWWGVVCVIVSHFHLEMALLDEEPEYAERVNSLIKYGQILNFIDSHYGDVSAPEDNFLNLKKNHKDRVTREDDRIKPLTPMPKDATSQNIDQSEAGATPLGNNYHMYTDYVDALDTTKAKGEVQGLREPRNGYGMLIKQSKKPINVKNILNEYLKFPSRKTTEIAENHLFRVSTMRTTDLHVMSYFDGVTEQATIGARPIATIQTSTLVITTDSRSDNREKEETIDIASVNSNDITDLTRKTIYDHTTVKEDTASKTIQVTESTTNVKTQTTQTAVSVITWAPETIATVMGSTVLENAIIFENVSYSETTSLGIPYTTTEAVLESSITQIKATRSAFARTITYPEESPVVKTTTITTEESTQNFGTDESTQSTSVAPTEVTDNQYDDKGAILRQLPSIPSMLSVTPPTEIATNQNLDMPILLKMIESIAEDYPNMANLTQKFNESLQKYKMPTCGLETISTTEPPSTINFNDAKVIAKCFVCGLDVEGVPYSTACADAFAGDFIPLVPVDPKARGQIARYRKYCRYLDVNRVLMPEEEPHSVFGRFTGGCSVRWVDLSSIYTQRACRNRRRAVMGKHFASKRMAKLEMALKDVDNGCIISPVATLLPLSRGISLYARFHACVCTGTWCNRAVVPTQWMTSYLIMFVVVSYVS